MMRARDVTRYCSDLGWTDAPDLPEPIALPIAPSSSHGFDLGRLAASLEGCSRCRLCEQRRTIVFGEGDPRAEVMFIGEGPGADEDRTGRPFVGQAGKLLDEMIFALGFERAQVYIGNVVKCRPPGNRDPREDEMAACSQFLDRQIELIEPRVIVALGRVAARRLTGTDKPMGALRGRWTSYRSIPLIPIFHPAYLLRNELAKRTAWDDLKSVQRRLSGADSGSRA
jgi:uracil-DNA glycosylase family 4